MILITAYHNSEVATRTACLSPFAAGPGHQTMYITRSSDT